MNFNLNLTFSIAVTLFLIMDPLGNSAVFFTLLNGRTVKQQRRILIRELLIALTFIVGFYFIGETVLSYLQIDQHTIRIAGGMILFIISLKMVFPESDQNNSDLQTKDPFIVPIAIPLIAGPSLITTISVFAHQIHNHSIVLTAIFIAWITNLIIYMSMPYLISILGTRVMKACERLMGLVLIMISVQMFLDGLSLYIDKQ